MIFGEYSWYLMNICLEMSDELEYEVESFYKLENGSGEWQSRERGFWNLDDSGITIAAQTFHQNL